MNKKILGVAFSIVMLAILVAPVMAGKGQTKQSFKLVFEGLPSGDSIIHGNTQIYRDRSFTVFGDLYIEIGGVAIGKEFLEYSATMVSIVHLDKDDPEVTRFSHVQVRETIAVFSSETHNDDTFIGNLEILAIGDNKAINGANFAGQGTDELKGVKVKGTSEPYEILPGHPDAPVPPGLLVRLTRSGTIMGWP